MVSFDSDHSGGDGASSFFSQVSSFYRSCWGVWKEFFLSTLLIGGVVDLGCWVRFGLGVGLLDLVLVFVVSQC